MHVCPGMCVKTKNIAGDKVFINFCKVNAIPPAKPISENALQDIIANENYDSDYRYVQLRKINVAPYPILLVKGPS